MANRTVRALIFDFDGLILDTETTDYQAWCEVYADHGCELPVDVWAQAVGRGFDAEFEPFAYLESQIGRAVDRESLNARRRQRDLDLIASKSAFPGVEDWLKAAKDRGLKIAIASSSRIDWVAGHLDRLNLRHYFDNLVTADNVTNTKPDPELFLMACKLLGVEPSEAIVLEDSPNGVLAARRAGIFVIAVPNDLTSRMVIDSPDLTLNSLAELTLDQAIAHIQTNGAKSG